MGEKRRNPKVSVIVPIYNAERYLHRCIDSLLAQTLTDYELLLVNDGSTDSSSHICNQYASKDNRIRVFHKENGGVSTARQHGIEHAVGEYSIHVDPDDWVKPHMLEEMYAKAIADDADMVICDIMIAYPNGVKYRQQNPQKVKPHHVLERLLKGYILGSLCNKLIRVSCYRTYGIKFIKGLNHCEDYMVCVKLFLHNIKITYLNKAYYYYDQIVNNHSITRDYTLATYYQRQLFLKHLKVEVNKVYHAGYIRAMERVAFECLTHNILSDEEFKRDFFVYRFSILCSSHPMKQRIALFLAACGYQTIARKLLKANK